MQHTHDVKVFWEFWPWNHVLLTIDKNILDGYSWNWLNNFLSDFFLFPRLMWNFFFEIFAFPINWFFDFLNLLGNYLWSGLDGILNLFGIIPWLQRALFWPVLFPTELLVFGPPTVVIVSFFIVCVSLAVGGIVWAIIGLVEMFVGEGMEDDAAAKLEME